MLTYNPPSKPSLERDNLFDDVVKLVRETGIISASLIQRHLKLGYARSARLLDQLEENGIVGPANGAKPREVLIPHTNREGQTVVPHKEPEPVKEEFEETPVKWRKTNYADNKPDDFEIELGRDENNKPVGLNLKYYGNLLVIGSQFTGAVDLLNSVLATSMTKYSPEELRLIVIDGVRGDLIIPNQAPHLLTPIIVEPEKSISALKWSVAEIEKRSKMESSGGYPSVLILINAINQILCFSPAEVEDNLYRIMVQGRKHGFYFVIGTDYPNPRTLKEIIANSPAKLVFKPTDKKVARETGVIESIDLESPNEAILETMFEGKKKLTINKVNPKQIYDEIFQLERDQNSF